MFKEFLKTKGITETDYASKSVEEMAQLQNEYNDARQKELKDEIAKAATKSDLDAVSNKLNDFLDTAKEVNDTKIKELETALKLQGEELTTMKDKHTSLIGEPLSKQLKENTEKIKDIAKGISRDEIVVKANTLRASITSNAQTMDLNDIGQLANAKLTAYDIFRKIPVSETNNNGTIRYYDWDSATIARAAAAVAEGAAFPASTAKWVTATLPIEKIGDTLPVSEEFYEDEAMFAAELEMFLDTNVKIKRNADLVNGTGVSNTLTGIVASVDAFTPVASGITDANIFDLLVKVSESITSVGGSKYQPDFALMNIADINKMKLKKDGNNNYMIPPFVSRDGSNVAGIIVLEENSIVANTMVLGDRRYARIYEKAGITLSRGLVNAQFAEDMETLKVRTRLAFLIRGADKGGFAKVTSISAALTTLAL